MAPPRFGGPIYGMLSPPVGVAGGTRPASTAPASSSPPLAAALAAPDVEAELARTTKDLLDISRGMEREAAIDQVTDIVDQGIELQRETRAEQAAITAPISRAGYLVALVCGILIFWFISVYVFAGNRMLTGGLVVIGAIFFLASLRTVLDKKGAAYIARSHGQLFGLA